jgi:hypothetical protein
MRRVGGFLARRRGKGQQGFEFLHPGRGRIVTRKSRRPAELLDKREQRAVLVIRRAEVAQAEIRLVAEPLRKCRDDPRLADAGSPETNTTWPSPALARAQRRNSKSISSSRPTSGLSVDPRNASNRLATALGRSACHADTGPDPGFSRNQGEIRRETDCLLEGNGFEPSVPCKLSSRFH